MSFPSPTDRKTMGVQNPRNWTENPVSPFPKDAAGFGKWCEAWLTHATSFANSPTSNPDAIAARAAFGGMLPVAVCALLELLRDSLYYDIEPADPRELLAGLAACLPHQLARQWPDDWPECNAPAPAKWEGFRCLEHVRAGHFCPNCGAKNGK